MLDLSALKFQVDTSELEQASKTIATLVQDFSKIDKASQQAARTQAQTEKLLAQAAKENAQARKANADAAEKELKATITADKADQAREQSIRKTTKATEDQAASVSKLDALMQKSADTVEGMTQGLSKGQAAYIAYAKQVGASSEQVKILIDNQQTIRKLQGKEPFDNSASGALSLKNALTELNAANRLYGSGLELTSKQAKDLARDQLRLIESAKARGDSIYSVRDQLRKEQEEYVKLADQYNRAYSAEQKIIKGRQETINATKYVTSENERMAAALNQSNNALDKGATDKLVKYESSLRKMGLSQDEVTKKLGVYKTQLAAVQAQEQKRAEAFLARALMPQGTDVVVSLASGQNPFTVLLQQGGQVVDLFNQSGLAANKFGDAVKASFKNMIPSIMTVVSALGGLVVDAFAGAGAAAVAFVGKMTGINSVVSHTTDLLYLMGGGWVTVAKAMEFVGKASTVLAGTAIFAIVAALGAMAIGLKQVISENNDLAKAFALSGGSIAASHLELTGFVKALAASGATTGQATDALLAMAKAGTFTKDEILLVGKASIEMQKNFGIAIDDTVKQFAKLKEKPVEALIEIAQRSGMVAPEILKMVNELEKAGKVSEAAALAMKTYASVTTEQISQMKENYNGFALFIIKLGQGIKQFFSDTFKTLFVATDPNTQLANNLQAMQKRIDQLKGSVAYQAGSEVSKNQVRALEEQARMISSQISSSVRLAAEEEKRRLGNVEGAKILEASIKLQKEAEDAIDKSTRKTLNLEDYRKEFVSKKLEDAAKEKNIDIDKLRTNTDLVKLLEKQADIQYKKDHTKDTKQGIKDLETEIDLRNKDLGLLSSFNNELDAIERRRKATGNEDQYQASLRALIEKQPIYIKQQKEINDAHDLENKLLGKADGLGKDYYKTLELIQQRQDSGLYSPEKAEKLRQAAFDQTEQAKEQLKYITASTEASQKYAAEISKSLGDNKLQNQMLDDRVSLLGLTTEESKILSREQDRKNKLLKVELEYQAKILQLKNDEKLDPFDREVAILDAAKLRAEQEKTINREVAVQYAEDLDKEIRAVKDGISDSIVTALFEGGKAGTSKLRNVIIAELKKPVTLVVNAVVNTLVGSLLGNLLGGSTGSAGGGLLGSVGTSLLGRGAISAGGSMLGGFGSGFMSGFGETMAGSSFVGPSATAAGGATGFGATLGQFAPWIAGAVALFSIIKSLDDSGTYHTGGSAQYSAAGGSKTSSMVGFGTGFGEVVAGQATMDAMATLSKSLVEIFDGIAKTFGKTAGYEVAASFADDTSKDGAWGGLRVALKGIEVLNWENFRSSKWAPKEFGDGEAGYKQYLAAVAKDAQQILVDMDLPSWANKVFTDLGDTPSLESLSTAVATIGKMKAAYDDLTKSVVNFANITDDSFGALIEQFGGIDNLTAGMSTYFDQFYSETEKYQKLQKDMTESFAKLNIQMPTSRDEFRKLAESQDLNTEAGRKMYVELMQLATGFDTLADRTEALNAEIASSRQDLTDRILQQEADLLQAQGKTAEASAKQRELLDRQRARENERLMALNPELAALAYQLWLLEDQTAATTSAAQAEADRQAAADKVTADLAAMRKQIAQDMYDALVTAVEAEKAVLTARKAELEGTINTLTEIFNILKTNVKELYGEVDSTAAMQANQGRAVINTALQTGILPDSEVLTEAIGAVRTEISANNYRTKIEADRARLQFAAQLDLLKGSTEEQLTDAEKQLKATNEQIDKLDDILKSSKAMLDAFLGNTKILKTVAVALSDLNNYLGVTTVDNTKTPYLEGSKPSGSGSTGSGASFGGSSSGGSSVTAKYNQVVSLGTSIGYQPITDASWTAKLDSLFGIYHSYDGTGNLTGLLTAIQAAGGTMKDLSALSGYFESDWRKAAASVGIPAFANGGSYGGGLAMVGEQGPELINFRNPGQVYTAGQTSNILSGSDSRVEALERNQAAMQATLKNIADNTKRTADVLRNISPAGDSIQVESESFLEI